MGLACLQWSASVPDAAFVFEAGDFMANPAQAESGRTPLLAVSPFKIRNRP